MDFERRVLVVDDVPTMRGLIRDMLVDMGFKKVFDAEGADAAWDMIQVRASGRDKEIGLVICDWNLDGLSGLDLLRSVRNSTHSRDLPFLMVTSISDAEHIDRARQDGVSGYIVKPFTAEELRAKVAEVL